MENFEIVTQKTDTETEFIWCATKDLKLKVIPPKLRSFDYEDNAPLIISASFYGINCDNTVNANQSEIFDFEILDYEKGYFKEWSIDLFMEAIDYYCKVRAKNEPVISYGSDHRFYPFGGE